LSFESADSESPPGAASLEFDAAATDVSEIFVSPSQVEHDTGSGNYEAVVLEVEPPSESFELVSDPEPDAAAEPEDDLAHTDSIAADDWSLLDDDEPAADAESVIEESPLADVQEPETEPVAELVEDITLETAPGDPTWCRKCSPKRKPKPFAAGPRNSAPRIRGDRRRLPE
jgi:hypothetical protein